MGEDVEAQEFSRADRTRYREKVHRCLDVFERMLNEHQFDTDDPMTGLEVELNLNDAETRSSAVGAHQVMIGILPTLAPGHLSPSHMSANPRYQLLSEQILHARGEDIRIDITGPERLITTAESILPEGACTRTQFHVQTSPEQFAAYWNASQAISAVQIAIGANSPFCLGKELWRETRIPLFEQAA